MFPLIKMLLLVVSYSSICIEHGSKGFTTHPSNIGCIEPNFVYEQIHSCHRCIAHETSSLLLQIHCIWNFEAQAWKTLHSMYKVWHMRVYLKIPSIGWEKHNYMVESYYRKLWDKFTSVTDVLHMKFWDTSMNHPLQHAYSMAQKSLPQNSKYWLEGAQLCGRKML